MTMNLADMRTLVRRELHDEDASVSGGYRWSNAALDRHILRSVSDLSLAAPLEASTLLASDGTRDFSLGGVVGLVRVEAAEHPINRYPPAFVQFSAWGQTLTLLVDSPPASGQNVRVYYAKAHTLDASSSTVPSHLTDLVALGAAAYAAMEWAAVAAGREDAAGKEAARHYLALGKGQAAIFQKSLNRLAARSTVRTRQLYAPGGVKPSQSVVVGP
jgi:hypothetical protein